MKGRVLTRRAHSGTLVDRVLRVSLEYDFFLQLTRVPTNRKD